MIECSICGISSDEKEVYRGIHKEKGLVNICHKCYLKERIPLIEKKEIDWKEVDKRGTVRDRLSRMAKVNVQKTEIATKRFDKPQDVELKDLIEKGAKKEMNIGPKTYDDLIDNFNWAIMRKRRGKKMSRSELAEEVKESPIIIESLEKGVLPRDYILLIKKIENYLGLNLIKEKKRGKISSERIITESKVPTGLKISDLKEKTVLEKDVEEKVLNEIIEEKLKEEFFEGGDLEKDSLSLEEINLDKVKEIVGKPINEKDELSDEDIEDLIWGKG